LRRAQAAESSAWKNIKPITNKAKLGEENGYPKETSEGESSDQSEGSEGEEKSQRRTTPRSLRSNLHQQPTKLY